MTFRNLSSSSDKILRSKIMRFGSLILLALLMLVAAGSSQAQPRGYEPYFSDRHFEEVHKEGIVPRGVLPPGARMHAGDSLWSPNREFQLSCQRDGNLVLYRKGHPLWSSGTAGRELGECVMQRDGNLVLFGHDHHPIWTTGTQGNPGSFLSVQDDGNVVIYRPATPVWATGTNR
jgi:hypothetical protein